MIGLRGSLLFRRGVPRTVAAPLGAISPFVALGRYRYNRVGISVMLIAAFIVLAIAVLLGSVLAVIHLRTEAFAGAPWPLAALHGLVAIVGFVGLLFALQGPPRGAATGTASFGAIAAVLLALALLFGVAVLAMRHRGRRRAGALIGVHATLAVMGFVVLFVYIFP